MGLFNFFKKKPSVSIDMTMKEHGKTYTEQEYNNKLRREHPNNPAYHRTEKELDLSGDFFCKNIKEIQKRRDDLSNCYSLALTTNEIDLKIELLQKALEKYNNYKEWCYKYPGGKIYFQDKYEYIEGPDGSLYSKDEQIATDLRHQLYIKNEVIPTILNESLKANGILQSQLYTLFPDISKKELQAITNEMECQKQIKKTKKGNSYLIEVT